MKTQDVLDDLEMRGYEIKVSHQRAHVNQVKQALAARARGIRHELPAFAPRYMLNGEEISPRSGRTIVTISLYGKEVVQGVATCSPEDNFDKHTGFVKALGRAVGALEHLGDSLIA